MPAAGQAPADRGPLNSGVPSWLTLGVAQRVRYEWQTDIGLNPADDDGFLVQRLHLSADVRPSSKLRFFVQGQDSRAAGLTQGAPRPAMKDRMDLRQGYVQIGDAKEWGWDLTVGRQELVIGYERLIGVNQWANIPRTWDMARLGLQRGRDRVEIFSASVVQVAAKGFDEVAPGENVHGTHAVLRSVLPGHRFEPHVLWRTRPRVTDERGFVADSDIWTFGFRLADDSDGPWEYEFELDGQRGDYGLDQLRAWRMVDLLGYTWKQKPWKPRLLTEYTFASGDKRRGDGKIGRFDALPARAHRIWGMIDQVGGRNAKILQNGLHLRPAPRWTLRADHYFYWLATPTDDLYRHNGRLYLALPANNTATYIGHEVDVQAGYSVNEWLSLGGGLGRLYAGPVIERYASGASPALGFVFLQLTL